MNVLNRIYYNYYNIDKNFYFPLDKDYMNLIYMLKDEQIGNLSVTEMKKKYKNDIHRSKLNSIEDRMDFGLEKETMHITYPYQETIERIKILHNIVGEEKWIETFGFHYKTLCNFIILMIFRIFNYNYVHIIKDKTIIDRYEDAFPYSKKCYFTRKEFYSFFSDKEEINNILSFITVDIKKQSKKTDSTKLIHYNNKYYLFFIWDFLYNLFDEIECAIIEQLDNTDEYYIKKGKEFEKLCYDKLIENYPKSKVYNNIEYYYKEGNHEIDLVLELPKSYLIFECKSSEFNINKIETNKVLYEKLKKSFGRGFKTINDLNEYINEGNNEFYYNKGENKICFDFANHNVYFVNLSLYNIEYLQTQIQKVSSDKLRPVNIYPICWNYMDFGSMIKLSPINIMLFERYLERRTKLLNKKKNLTFDIDELDVFGFLTEPMYDHVYEMFINSNSNVDENFIISNGIYRRDFNQMFNAQYISEYIEKNTKIV